MPLKRNSSVRVLFSCTGVGIFNRGIESFFREAFDGLKNIPNLDARLVKGALQRSRNDVTASSTEQQEFAVWCLPRTGQMSSFLGKLTGRSPYAVEQWSSFLGLIRQIRQFRPNVVFTSEANLNFLLRRFRHLIRVPFRVLYSNGGPINPPFAQYDFVHQVAPFYRDEAIRAGEPIEKHLMVPYGIQVPLAPTCDKEAKEAFRRKLGLPIDRPIILSVGWIAKQHKRMDYVIAEVARACNSMNMLVGGGQRRPFLQLLGAIDQGSEEIVELGNRVLGTDNFSAKSIPYTQVADYYRAADCFILASLKEGFGRAYLEALMYGLPTIGHRHPVIEYVLGDVGVVADLSKPGSLAQVLVMELRKIADQRGSPRSMFKNSHANPLTTRTIHERWSSVNDRFSWAVLRPQYLDMFHKAAFSNIKQLES